jgi:hypothetical protein
MYAALQCKATLVQERLNVETIDRNFVTHAMVLWTWFDKCGEVQARLHSSYINSKYIHKDVTCR